MYKSTHYDSKILWGMAWGQMLQCLVNPYELLTLFLQMQQCRWTFDPISETSWFLGMDQSMSDAYQLTYNHRGKTDLCVKIGCGWISIDFPLLFLFTLVCPTQGHPIEASSTHSSTCPTIWIKERFKQVPHSTCIFIPLHAPIFIVRISFYLSLTLNINPL